MPPRYRVQYSLVRSGRPPTPAEVLTLDTEGDLDAIPGQLPPGAYIMYIEDLVAGQGIHWTRWPHAFRPGFVGQQSPFPSA